MVLMNKAPLKTEHVTFWIENGIIHTTYVPGLIVTFDIAKQIVEERIEYTSGLTYPGLANVNQAKKADYDAMKYWATADAYRCLSSLSVYSNNRLTNIFVNFWLKVDKPPKPSKFFTNIDDAYLFLQPYKFLN